MKYHSIGFLFKRYNRLFSYYKKIIWIAIAIDRTIFHPILESFRNGTIVIEALTPVSRTSCIKCTKITLDLGSFVK